MFGTSNPLNHFIFKAHINPECDLISDSIQNRPHPVSSGVNRLFKKKKKKVWTVNILWPEHLRQTGCCEVSLCSWTCAFPSFFFHIFCQQLWSWLSDHHLMRCVWGRDWRRRGEYQRLTFLCHLTSQEAHYRAARAGVMSSAAPRTSWGRTQDVFYAYFKMWLIID